jgi:hypothetical protein
MHPSCINTNTVFKWTKTTFHKDRHHLGVPSGASEMILEPVVHLVQVVHLSCVKISTISTSIHLSVVT